MPVILALRRRRKKDQEVKANCGYTVSSRLAWATYIARSDFLKNKLDVVPHAFSQRSTQDEKEESGVQDQTPL